MTVIVIRRTLHTLRNSCRIAAMYHSLPAARVGRPPTASRQPLVLELLNFVAQVVIALVAELLALVDRFGSGTLRVIG